MKKNISIGLITLSLFLMLAGRFTVSAQGMMRFFNSSSDDKEIQSQIEEERIGRDLLDNLKNKTVNCSELKDDDFDKIGEYFMGQSIGDTQRHISMNEMMKKMMGEKGEEQVHIVMGKRLSGCNISAVFPSQDTGFLTMMGMFGMMGTNKQLGGGFSGMMSNNWGIFGVITWIFVIFFLILGIIYFWKEINKK